MALFRPPGLGRRGLLQGAATAAAAPAVPARAHSPDAALLAHCAAFDALQRRRAAIFAACHTIEAEDAAEAEDRRILRMQHGLVRAMAPACSRAGARAKARSLLLFAPELVGRAHGQAPMAAMLLASVLADAAAGGVA